MSGAWAHSPAGAIDLVALVEDAPNPRHETFLAGWGAGWDAAAEFFRPRLAQAEADRDRYYAKWLDKPDDLRKRLDAGAEEYWRRWLAEGVGSPDNGVDSTHTPGDDAQ